MTVRCVYYDYIEMKATLLEALSLNLAQPIKYIQKIYFYL